MDELKLRLSKAVGPDRALDCEVDTLITKRLASTWRTEYKTADEIQSFADEVQVRCYTDSIDAALSILHSGWHLIALSQLSPNAWIVKIGDNIRDDLTAESEAPTAALALLSAVVDSFVDGMTNPENQPRVYGNQRGDNGN